MKVQVYHKEPPPNRNKGITPVQPAPPRRRRGDAKHGEQEEPENRNIVTAESIMKDTMQGKG
jgi:hypothetical protein